MTATLVLDALQKSFGAGPVVDGISLTVEEGEFLTLLGPSGCGKTTTLNLVAGFLSPDGGRIAIGGRDVTNVPPHHRDIGLVFQDYALFPHRTVAENVGFGLRMRKVERAEIKSRVAEALALVQLEGLADRRPGQLSGGQRQRVALARALVIRPSVLLLDEPLSNLDLKLREDMRLEISGLQRRLDITTILVTHDQGEALVMSDRVAVMRGGRIAQVADPATLYTRPANRFIADLIGAMNFLPCRTQEACPEGAVGLVALNGQVLPAMAPRALGPGMPAMLAFRPEQAKLASMPGDALRLEGRVDRIAYLGGRTELHLVTEAGACVVDVASGVGLPGPSEPVMLTVSASDCLVFPVEP